MTESTCATLPGGTKEWRNADGQIHREGNLPAIEHSSGGKAWWINGLRHRTDGPAVEGINDYKEWFLEGEPLTETEYRRRIIILELAGVTQ